MVSSMLPPKWPRYEAETAGASLTQRAQFHQRVLVGLEPEVDRWSNKLLGSPQCEFPWTRYQ